MGLNPIHQYHQYVNRITSLLVPLRILCHELGLVLFMNYVTIYPSTFAVTFNGIKNNWATLTSSGMYHGQIHCSCQLQDAQQQVFHYPEFFLDWRSNKIEPLEPYFHLQYKTYYLKFSDNSNITKGNSYFYMMIIIEFWTIIMKIPLENNIWCLRHIVGY